MHTSLICSFFLQNHLTFRDIANIKLMRYDEM